MKNINPLICSIGIAASLSGVASPLLKEEKEYLFSTMHVTMSSLRAGDVVPLHHHAQSEGFLFIASGSARIQTYAADKNELYHLRLVSDQIYGAGDHALVTKHNNVHRIEALERTEIVDAFSVSPDTQVQSFLLLVGLSDEGALLAREATIDEVGLAPHILEKDRTMPKIRVEDEAL